jgi:hypothetical protein
MASTIRFLVLFLVLTLGGRTAPSPTTSPDDLARFVAWGEGRFATAGLVLPEVTYEFHTDTEPCNWRRGLYDPNRRIVDICTMSNDTLVHELAHAWAEAHLGNVEREAFLTRRGLTTWANHAHPWRERGTEHAAEIIAWGLAAESDLVRWVDAEHGGRVSFRLLTIDDSSPEQLWEEYRLLTGSDPVLRDPQEWSTAATTPAFSPESARLGG